jgi:hypothetical protein
MEIIKEIKNTEKIVEKFLQEDERCRNDDKWLTYKVFQHFAESYGKKIFLPFELFSEFPSFETVSRCRRKFQNNKSKYLPTSELVRVKRGIKEDAFKKWAVKD